MAYGNYNNTSPSQWQDVNVKTNSLTLFSNEGDRLKITYYNESLSIEIVNPVAGDDGKKSYAEDKANIGKVTLILERAYLLNNLCENFIIRISDRNKYSRGIFTNKDNNSMLSLYVTADGVPSVIIYSGFDEECHPKNSATFTFKSIPFIDGYDSTTGKYENVSEVHMQAAIFVMAIRAFCDNANQAAGHFNKMSDRYASKKAIERMAGIASKLGVSGGYNSNYSNGMTNTQSGGFNMQSTQSAPVIESADNLASLIS